MAGATCASGKLTAARVPGPRLSLSRAGAIVRRGASSAHLEEPEVLADGVGGALEPVGVVGGLLGSEHLDEALAGVGAHVGVLREGSRGGEGQRGGRSGADRGPGGAG